MLGTIFWVQLWDKSKQDREEGGVLICDTWAYINCFKVNWNEKLYADTPCSMLLM